MVTNKGCICTWHIHCVNKLDVVLLGVVIAGVHSITGFKIPLHATTLNFNNISWTHCGPTKNFLSHIDYYSIIIHKTFKEFKPGILKIENFNNALKH